MAQLPAEIFQIIIFWTSDSCLPNCSLTNSHFRPFAQAKLFQHISWGFCGDEHWKATFDFLTTSRGLELSRHARKLTINPIRFNSNESPSQYSLLFRNLPNVRILDLSYFNLIELEIKDLSILGPILLNTEDLVLAKFSAPTLARFPNLRNLQLLLFVGADVADKSSLDNLVPRLETLNLRDVRWDGHPHSAVVTTFLEKKQGTISSLTLNKLSRDNGGLNLRIVSPLLAMVRHLSLDNRATSLLVGPGELDGHLPISSMCLLESLSLQYCPNHTKDLSLFLDGTFRNFTWNETQLSPNFRALRFEVSTKYILSAIAIGPANNEPFRISPLSAPALALASDAKFDLQFIVQTGYFDKSFTQNGKHETDYVIVSLVKSLLGDWDSLGKLHISKQWDI